MRVEKTGKKYPHIYPPLISKELFEACEQIRLGRKKKGFKHGEKEYVFRGLIECAVTGRVVTADTKYKTYTNGRKASWTYLRAWDKKGKQVFMKEETALAVVEKVFSSMQLEPKMLEDVISCIKTSASAEQDFYKRRIAELHSEHTKILSRMDRLTDLFLDGDLDKNTHEEKRAQLSQRREEILREIENHGQADDSFAKTLITLVELASGALKTFRGSTTEGKRQLINLVFANLKCKSKDLI
jgi:hypothetical protein